MNKATKRLVARWGIWTMITVSVAAIVWRIAEPHSPFSEAACLAMWSYILLYLAVVPRSLWNAGA